MWLFFRWVLALAMLVSGGCLLLTALIVFVMPHPNRPDYVAVTPLIAALFFLTLFGALVATMKRRGA